MSNYDPVYPIHPIEIVTGRGKMVTLNNRVIHVVPHAHSDQGTIHFHMEDLTAGTYRVIVIDISDTDNYPHTKTDYVHLEWLEIEVDGDVIADYQINLGYLENVDENNGDRTVIKHWSGTKTAGRSIREFITVSPNGWKMKSDFHTTHMKSLNDTNYQTDANLVSTLDPTTADTPSGNGDVVMEIVVNAGSINMSFETSYHGHDELH
jgi:hypothetical protein